MLVEFFTKILRKRAIKFTKENFDYIENEDLAVTTGYYNHKCHWNAYNDYIISKNKVVATICISPSDNEIFCHYINCNQEKGYYYDVTFGSAQFIYYYQYPVGVCDLSIDEIENMDTKLDEFKKWLISKSFKNKLVIKFYHWLEDKYNII